MRNLIAFCCIVILVIFISACSPTGSDNDCICTEVFVTDFVYVVDASGNPIDSLSTLTINEATGDTLENKSGAFVYEPGMYWLIDDSYIQSLTTSPQNFIFTAKNDSISVSAVYQYATDNCKCHVERRSGPDTLRVRQN